MKKTIVMVMVLVLGLFAVVGSSYAVDTGLLWKDLYPSYQFEPDQISARSESVVADSNGNVYWAGRIPLGYYDRQYFVRKYDPSGNLLWHQAYDSGYFNEWRINQITLRVDGQDNLYLAAMYGDKTKTGMYSNTALVLKYNPDGNLLWAYTPDLQGSMWIERVMGLELDSAGNAYLLSAALPLPRKYRIDKIGPNGNLIWTDHRAGATTRARDYIPWSLTLAPNGNVYVTTVTGRTIKYEPSGASTEIASLLPYPTYHISSIDVDLAGNIYAVFYENYWVSNPFIAKFNHSGNLLWQTGILFSGASEPHIQIDLDGNLVFVHGGTYDTYTNLLTSNEPGIISKYDPSGNLLWSGNITLGTARDVAKALIDIEGNIYVSGAATINGRANAYAMKFSPSGELLWESSSNISDYHDYPMTAAVDPSGNLLTAGLVEKFYVQPGWNFYFRGTFFVAKFGPSNSPPVADAGADQSVECGPSVTLYGSGSSDLDGDALTYTWSGPFGTVTGVTASVTLPLGTHSVTLTVDDGNGGTSSDDVVITVVDTTPPVMTIASLSGTKLQPGLYLANVLFEMSASDSCSGVASVSYTLDGVQNIVTGSYASATVSTGGEHTISSAANDNAGNTSVAGNLSFTLFEANADGLISLIDYFVDQGLISPKMQTSLTKQASHGSYQAFINHVEAQSGKKIDPAVAQILIQAALYIMNN